MPIDALKTSDMNWVKTAITIISIAVALLSGMELRAQSSDHHPGDAKSDLAYCQKMWELYIESSNNNQWEDARNYLKEYLIKGEPWVGKQVDGTILMTEILYAHVHVILGEIELYQLSDYNASLTSYTKGIEILKDHGLVVDYPYSDVAYRGAFLCCHYLDRLEERKAAQTRLTDVMRVLSGGQSDNFISYKKDIISFCISVKDWSGVIEEGVELARIYRDRDMAGTATYLELAENLITSYHNTHDYITEASLFAEYEALSDALGLKESENYCTYLGLKAEAMTILFRNDEYEDAIKEQTRLTHKLWGEFSWQSAIQEVIIANHHVSMDESSVAYEHVKRCYEILDSEECRFNDSLDSLRITSQIHNLEGLIFSNTDPQAAEEALLKAIEEYTATGLNMYAPLNNLGLLYHNVQLDYPKAVEYFIMAKEVLEKEGYNSSIEYISTLNNIGLCYQNLGMSSYSISIYDLAEDIVLKNYGSEHLMYATIVQNKSKFYAQIGDYESALSYGSLARDCMGRIFGTESEKYGLCLQNLGMYHIWMKQWEEAKKYLTTAVDILDKTNVLFSIPVHINLLNIYSNERNWELFDQTVNRCVALIKEYGLVGTDTDASLNGTVGYCMVINNMLEGKQYLRYAMDLVEKNGNEDSPEYFTSLLVYHLASFMDGTNDEEIITSLTEGMKNVYFSNAVYYNTIEREAFANSPKFSLVKEIIFSARSTGERDSYLYDFLLFNKGLLLGTSLNYEKAVYDSADEELISKYEALQRKSEGTSTNASVLEREITLALRQKGGFTEGMSYTYTDVQDAMEAHEVAIEFVSHLNYIDNTVYYAALVLEKKSEPIYIRLGKAEDIERLAALSADKLYNQTAASKELYDKIWEPVLKHLGSATKIIFSPAGTLNTLAIEHLYDGKKRICESIDLIRVTSTKEICSRQHQHSYAEAVLYGGLEYDSDIETMVEESRSIKGGETMPAERFRGCVATDWTYLPGTLTEVEKVSDILDHGKISYNLYTAERGNEESFKNLSGSSFDILHIATHGFYMSETQAARTDYFSLGLLTDNGSAAITSPLSRSGLMLSGGNNAWSGMELPDYIEDGILSAAEIAGLDFNSCDIVVLSACETGLGEITDEGVFGLQRAFKNAGVNTIVMSLWEVDDMATSYMMQMFYKNLIKGKAKRDAFTAAQEEVRKKYPDPRYWAAFIMLD